MVANVLCLRYTFGCVDVSNLLSLNANVYICVATYLYVQGTLCYVGDDNLVIDNFIVNIFLVQSHKIKHL